MLVSLFALVSIAAALLPADCKNSDITGWRKEEMRDSSRKAPFDPSCSPRQVRPFPAKQVTELHPSVRMMQLDDELSFDIDPQDLKVFMAIGDSITAGACMKGMPLEYRGSSFSIGADDDGLTLPNLFHAMYPSQRYAGMSVGTHPPEGIGSAHIPTKDHLNGAQSGARIFEVMDDEIGYIYDTLNTTASVNIDDDWKYMNIWIGHNDLCDCCTEKGLTADAFEKKLTAILQRLHSTFRRTVVGVMSLFRLSSLRDLERHNLWCKAFHQLYVECSCIFKGTDEDLSKADERTVEYNQRIRNVVRTWSVLEDDEFAVILIPFTENLSINSTDQVSTFDCFHPSTESHKRLAIELWNSLLQPEEFRPTGLTNSTPICPDDDARIYTR